MYLHRICNSPYSVVEICIMIRITSCRHWANYQLHTKKVRPQEGLTFLFVARVFFVACPPTSIEAFKPSPLLVVI